MKTAAIKEVIMPILDAIFDHTIAWHDTDLWLLLDELREIS